MHKELSTESKLLLEQLISLLMIFEKNSCKTWTKALFFILILEKLCIYSIIYDKSDRLDHKKMYFFFLNDHENLKIQVPYVFSVS